MVDSKRGLLITRDDPRGSVGEHSPCDSELLGADEEELGGPDIEEIEVGV